MSELPPDLPRLQTLETYLRLQLVAVRAAIAQLQQQPEGYTLQVMRTRPDTPLSWLHRAGCPTGGGPELSRSEALIALGEPGVQPCDGCRPDRELAAERPRRSGGGSA